MLMPANSIAADWVEPTAPATGVPSVTPMVGEAEWDEYVGRHPDATVYHAFAWRRVFERAFGHRCVYLGAHDRRGRLTGVLGLVVFDSALFGRYMVSLPFVNHGGVLADDVRTERALLDAAVERGQETGCSHIELRHLHQRFSELPHRTHKVTMRMSLPHDIETTWNRLDRRVRNHVRKAQKSGITVECGGIELLDDFYRVFAENMRDLGTPVYPKGFFAETLRAFPGRARLFVARYEGLPAAASLSMTWGKTFEVPSASSLKSMRTRVPNYQLYWTMLERATAEGYETFDFGRSTPGDGTYNHKLGWGAVPGPICWEYHLSGRATLPHRQRENSGMRPITEMWMRLPLSVANALGPRIVRYLP